MNCEALKLVFCGLDGIFSESSHRRTNCVNSQILFWSKRKKPQISLRLSRKTFRGLDGTF